MMKNKDKCANIRRKMKLDGTDHQFFNRSKTAYKKETVNCAIKRF